MSAMEEKIGKIMALQMEKVEKLEEEESATTKGMVVVGGGNTRSRTSMMVNTPAPENIFEIKLNFKFN
ncbi:conserved hypothetical protein [Ricinus communis]|uniref:Uncharacterized protein n=1 Tax=Ricinus communis TaxID=3988 RepID=B9SSB3_RICCO|nr:conserved hypothetical protein [Ricinus communis]